jgi:uncharacterized protein
MAGTRVVLDTNFLVSGLAYPTSTPGRIVAAWRAGALEVVLSRYILGELARLLPRLERLQHWTARDTLDLVDSLALLADMVDPLVTEATEADLARRDPADLPVLGTLLASRADYLVTGDKDLLALADKYPVVTPATFWARHG